MHRRTPFLPELHFDVLDRVDAVSVKPGLLDPVLVYLDHPVPHVAALGPEIIQPAQLTQLDLGCIVIVPDVAVVVEEDGERGVGGVQVKRRRVLPIGLAVHEVAAMVHDDVVNHEQAAGMGGLDHVLQVGQRAPMRVNPIKVLPGVAVEFAPRIQHHR